MNIYSVSDIKKIIQSDTKVAGNEYVKVSRPANPDNANNNSIIFINRDGRYNSEILQTTAANIIVCHLSENLSPSLLAKKCFLLTDNPKLVYARLIKKLFPQKSPLFQTHPTAVISPNAKIAKKVHIGPFTYIGQAVIETGTVIYGHCHIYDGVYIGKNSILHAGCIIGADGFGYVKNENKEYEQFPQIGKVIIEDNVEIGANCCVDKGALNDTIIKSGVKIDNLVHIGHNSVVGKNTMITANVVFSGSTVVGDRCYFAPNVTSNGHLKIGNNVFVGTGSVITKDIPDGETWVGSPARPIDEFRKIQTKIKKI